MTSPFHSIRWRLQAWHGLILLGVIVAFCLTAYRLAWNNQLRRIDKNLAQTERTLIRSLMRASQPVPVPTDGKPAPDNGPPASPREFFQRLRERAVTIPAETTALFSGDEPGFAYFSFRDSNDTVLLQSANAPADLVLLSVPKTDFVEDTRTTANRREVIRSSSQGTRSLVGFDLTPEFQEMSRFAWSLAASGLGVLLLGLIGGWWQAGRAIQPIAAISQTASRIAEGNLEERISTSGTDSELDQLSRVLNQTFERLHDSFERQKQFTSDVSHELRTPVTILLAETQRILKRERTPEEYRETIQTCFDTASRMRDLIKALLLLARQETTAARLPREPCDLAVLLQETVRHLQPLAAAHEVRLHTDLQPAVCRADPDSLSILATNLITNATQHHQGGGNVWISTLSASPHVLLSVRDDGPGIPGEDLPHIFQRFYRADKARASDDSGHTGLGLAIAKTIVDNHGGVMEVESELDKGASFRVRLAEFAQATSG